MNLVLRTELKTVKEAELTRIFKQVHDALRAADYTPPTTGKDKA